MTTRLEEALAHHRAGRFDEAAAIYEDALRDDPRNSDAWQFLGLIALTRGDAALAVQRINGAIEIDPQSAVYHFNLGLALRSLGDVAGAIGAYRRAIELASGLVEAHQNLASCLREIGDLDGALAACRQAIALRPTYVDAHLNLSRVLHELGRLEAAETAARRGIALNPNAAAGHFQLGNVLQAGGRHAEAEAAYRESLRIDADFAGLHVNLGNVLVALGRIEAAGDSYRRALGRDPADMQAHFGFVRTRLHLGLPDEAIAALERIPAGDGSYARDFAQIFVTCGCYFGATSSWEEGIKWLRKAVATQPDLAAAHFNLALGYQNVGRLNAAAEHYARTLEIDATLVQARKNLALMWLMLGRPGDAIAVYRDGTEVQRSVPDFQRLLVAATMYDPSWSNQERFAEARRFAELYAKNPPPPALQIAVPDPRRRLRIGYLTSDFRDHPVARNIEPLLEHRDRDRFEVVAYAGVQRSDAMTERLRGLVDVWRSTLNRSDEEVGAQIRADGIDILVLLAAHLDENRPLVCAYRPAPIQISFHDVATSGLDQVDYLVADRVVCPRGGTEQFTERVICLPSIYTHRPLSGAPAVKPPAFEAAGHVTFGSFNSPSKLNGAVLGLWGQILAAVPSSRLVLKFRRWFHAPDMQARILAAFSAQGIDPERIEFAAGDDPLEDHLRSYERVDIALDTHPFAGSTTTFEALWMGVPVVTLSGETMMSRWSASILSAIGCRELVTESAQAYVSAAAALARDRDRLRFLHATLRDRLQGSPLVNGPLRARQIERIYRTVWARWCASHETTAVPA